jgi:hypothetical protein
VDCIGVIPITVYIGGANQHLPVVANRQVQVWIPVEEQVRVQANDFLLWTKYVLIQRRLDYEQFICERGRNCLYASFVRILLRDFTRFDFRVAILCG